MFVRSEVAHGVLRGIDLDAARAQPRVAAAYANLPFLPDVPPMMDPEAVQGRPWPPLAHDRVRYAGQPVAIVVGDDRYVAEDARDAVQAVIDPLPVLLDPTDAADSDVQLFPGSANVAAEKEFGAGRCPGGQGRRQERQSGSNRWRSRSNAFGKAISSSPCTIVRAHSSGPVTVVSTAMSDSPCA